MTAILRLSSDAWCQLAEISDPARRRAHWQTRLKYRLSGSLHSSLNWVQNTTYAEQLRAANPLAPLFILGFWRSGTTFLHELFCCDPQFAFPTTYSCLNPSHFLLSEDWNRKGGAVRAKRPMDDVSFSWVSPQEDEFALLAMGAPSPYQALVFPSLMCKPRWLVDLSLRSLESRTKWSEALKHFLRLLSVRESKVFVLKSPPHGFRLPFLPALFPGARFVLVERNPYEVFTSNVKLWRTLLELYALEEFSNDEIENFIFSAYLVHEELIAVGEKHLAGKLVRVRYEDLIADPMAEMSRLYAELAITGFERARPLLSEHLLRVAGHRRNKFVLSSALKDQIDQRWGETIHQKGYDWPSQYITVSK